MKINNAILDLINYAINKNLIQNDDFEYVLNRLTDLLKLEETLNFYGNLIPNYTHSCTLEIFGGGLKDCCKDQKTPSSYIIRS